MKTFIKKSIYAAMVLCACQSCSLLSPSNVGNTPQPPVHATADPGMATDAEALILAAAAMVNPADTVSADVVSQHLTSRRDTITVTAEELDAFLKGKKVVFGQAKQSSGIIMVDENGVKYPLFDSDKCSKYWKMLRSSADFSQADFSEALDLAITAYTYLNAEYESILASCPTYSCRMERMSELDSGKGSEMVNYTQVASRRFYTMGVEGMMDGYNVAKLNTMLEKKITNRTLLDRISTH